MRPYTLPDNKVIDLDSVISVGELFINKSDPIYNCYEVYLSNGSLGVFDDDLTREQFITDWGNV